MNRKPADRILIVDDEPHVAELLSRWLRAQRYDCAVAFSAEAALALLETVEFHLVFCDIMMPGMSGLDLLRIVRKKFPKVAVLMVTAVDDRSTAILTLELGAYGYIIKPFQMNEILIHAADALARRETALLGQQYDRNLEEHLKRHEAEIRHREEIVLRMITASGRSHGETGAHLRRVAGYSSVMARAAASAWTLQALEDISLAAAMHDLGKIAITQSIWNKTERLSPQEFSVAQQHAELGARLLGDSDATLLRMARKIALSHHERWDGEGYPHGIAGEAIPESARIVAIADVYDALLHRRLWRPAFSEEEAISIMVQEKGKHFDPRLLEVFLRTLPEIRIIRQENRDDDW